METTTRKAVEKVNQHLEDGEEASETELRARDAAHRFEWDQFETRRKNVRKR